MNTFFTESSMSDSFIYSIFNRSNEMQTTLLKAMQNGVKLDKRYIEEQLIQLQRSRISALIPIVLAAFEEGKINLLFVKNMKLTKAIPFILHKTPTGIQVTIFISSFATLDETTMALIIPAKTLYTLMESAYIALYMQEHPMRLQRNSVIIRTLNAVYTEMWMRVLNRDFALTLDKVVNDKVAYAISKFFLTRVAELENKTVCENYAASICPNLSQSELLLLNDQYDHFSIVTVEDLIGFLKSEVPRMGNLTIRYFVERFLNSYGQSSILAVDYFPYMFLIMVNTILGTFIVNQPSISDIVKNTQGSSKFYSELVKMM